MLIRVLYIFFFKAKIAVNCAHATAKKKKKSSKLKLS